MTAEIYAREKWLDTAPIARLLRCQEADADEVMIHLARWYGTLDLSGFTFLLTAVSVLNTAAVQTLELIAYTDKELVLRWRVTDLFTAVAGKLTLELRAADADGAHVVIFTGEPIDVVSPVGGEGLLTPTVTEQFLSRLAQQVADAQNQLTARVGEIMQSVSDARALITAQADGIMQNAGQRFLDHTDWDAYFLANTVRSDDAANLVRLTQAQYDALTVKNPATLYCIC
ncbi:MAG: hypothetical protein QM689_05830 [Oscillospiraceae bacterium]